MANGINVTRLKREIKREEEIVTSQDVLDAWEARDITGLQLWILDDLYSVVHWDIWTKILQHCGLSKLAYERERFDCDDFAFALRGKVAEQFRINSIKTALDWSGRHAYNCVFHLKKDGKLGVAFLEPQTSRKVVTGRGQYLATRGVIV